MALCIGSAGMNALGKPEFITFTGVDDQTSIDGMRELSSVYPIEWAVLFSPKRQGIEPRYPAVDTMERVGASGLRLAAHLCGRYADLIMDGDWPAVPIELGPFSRIQVNHCAPVAVRLAEFSAKCGLRCIGQARTPEFPEATEVEWLFDASGGRGIVPSAWPPHPGVRLCGYAGGLGPDNVACVLEAIGATGPYWIDMESQVRSNDRLDLRRAEQVCRAVYGKR